MKRLLLAAVGLTVAVPAWAQRPSVQTQSLPPLQSQGLQDGSPQILKRSVLPGGSRQGEQPSGQVQSGQQPAGAEPPNVWLPSQSARLQALDKVNAQTTALTIKVGQSATVGSLTITVKACLIRPADQPQDAAAYLDVTDSHSDSAGFKGWMLETEPSVSMMQHPIYDLRVTGCA